MGEQPTATMLMDGMGLSYTGLFKSFELLTSALRLCMSLYQRLLGMVRTTLSIPSASFYEWNAERYARANVKPAVQDQLAVHQMRQLSRYRQSKPSAIKSPS